MSRPADLLARAATAFARRELDDAARACGEVLAAEPRNADAMHLLGLVLKQSGDAAGAEPLLRASIERAPGRAEFRVNFSNLLRAIDRLPEAEAELRAALEIDPGSRNARLALARLLNARGEHAQAEAAARPLLDRDPRDAEAWAALAAAERDQGKLAEAEASFRRALALRPDYAVARHNLGALLGRMKRPEESLSELERAAALGVDGVELELNRASALIELARFGEAEAALASLARRAPERADAQMMLAKLRYMRGEPDFTRALRDAAHRSASPSLILALGDLLRRAGRLEEAEAVLRSIVKRHPDVPQIESSLAVVLQEQGKLDDALARARRASAALPADPAISENVVAILLQTGDGDAPWDTIMRERRRSPLDQRWLAYEATAARLSGRSRYEELYDYERFVQAFELEPPPGYRTIDELNADLAAHLDSLHLLEAHPLDQSLRHGTQSPRDLLHDPDPVIQPFIAVLAKPLSAYCRRLGADPSHPFVARNRGSARLAGCWSVRLHRGGYHVNHVHPAGWISSAYYVTVPAEVEDARSRSGWIRFGEPRMPPPGAGPAHSVQPRTGMLLLFPSYMWHGTTPLRGEAPRLTLAFDALPQAD